VCGEWVLWLEKGFFVWRKKADMARAFGNNGGFGRDIVEEGRGIDMGVSVFTMQQQTEIEKGVICD
jgi:hypothetical protein